MDPVGDHARAGAITPEVEPVTSLLLHPLLQDPKFLAAVFGLLVTVIFFTGYRGRSKRSRKRTGPATVMLVGPTDGGKTSIFANLVHHTYPQTHTSIQPSITTFALPSSSGESKQIRLIDLPGHPRLRDETKKHVQEASAVVFVVDVVGIVRNAGSVAEDLPPLLTSLCNRSLRSSLPPPKLLILAHKADLLIRPTPPSSPSPPNIPSTIRSTARERLKSILTREMDRLKSVRGGGGVCGRIEGMGKVSRTGGGGWFSRLFGASQSVSSEGEGEGEEDEALVWGGKGPFRWEDMEGVSVAWGVSGLGMVNVGKQVAAVSEVEEGDGSDELKEFLREA